MDKATAIQIRRVSKRYLVGRVKKSARQYNTFRDAITEAAANPFRRVRNVISGRAQSAADLTDSIWALKDVSFAVQKGEVVGIIGHNGAGKSTLLKVLTRITSPTQGAVAFRGRLGALLEAGTGFHPELTGRENVYLNGAILGMKRHEIAAKFDAIIEFAGVEQLVDTPVKHYSSGMYVRLAFAVAAHLELEILVVDEVLSVGDAEFQKRSLSKMKDVANSGRTILFVSHNMAAVLSLCSQGVLLERGKLKAAGNIKSIIQNYQNSLSEMARIPLLERTDRRGNGDLRFASVELRSDHQGSMMPVGTAMSGESLLVILGYQTHSPVPLRHVTAALHIDDFLGRRLVTCFTEHPDDHLEALPPSGEWVCQIPRLNLAPGSYRISLTCKVRNTLADGILAAGTLEVNGGDFFGMGDSSDETVYGPMLLDHCWHLRERAME